MDIIEKLRNHLHNHLPDYALDVFLKLYKRYKTGKHHDLGWESIHSPAPGSIPRYDVLPMPDTSLLREELDKLIVCNLNGGLGTTLGCSGPKSTLVVRDGLSFLDLTVERLERLNRDYGVSTPLVLMNSFYTHAATKKIVERYKNRVVIELFQQNKFPRLKKTDESPLEEASFGTNAWYPPGHGDFYDCVLRQGMLDDWIARGKKVLFISNSDNLGAVVDERILHFMMKNDCPFLMELTDKTAAEVKGGTIYQDGERLHLLEVAQVPPQYMDDFCGTHKFKIFNTNNIWINLIHLKKRLRESPLDLDIIVNPKTVDGIDVIQLETAMGSAIGSFPGAAGLIVPRNRYLSVKRTNDLFLAQSDLFVLDKGRLTRNPARLIPALPLINFESPFTNMEEYFKRIPTVPSLVDLKSLYLEGDIWFEKGVVLKGDITLVSKQSRMTIPDGSVLENTVVRQ